MPYGTIKVDTVTFTNAGVDKSVTLSGLVQNPVFSGNVTVTGTLSGVTVTGTTANFTSGNFINISGGTHTITSGVFAAGSAASPSITFTGDLNTGIYSPGADQVAISTGGTQKLAIDSSGNVSLTGPNLSIGGAAPSNAGYSNLYVNNTSGAQLFLSVNGSNSRVIYSTATDLNYYISDSSPHIWFTNAGERMRLDASGRLGIGTSSPSATTKMSIVDSTSAGIYFLRTAQGETVIENTGPLTIRQSSGNGANQNIFFKTGASVGTEVTAMTIDGSQRVGIGTASPSATLQVSPSSGSANFQVSRGSKGLQINQDNDSADPNINTIGATALRFLRDGGESMRIDTSGRLLVGTSSASGDGLLQVRNDSGGVCYDGFRAVSTAAGAPVFRFNKSRGTAASPTRVNSGDVLGYLAFAGYDGAAFADAAYITAIADGTWTDGGDTTDNPGALVFSTTADGAAGSTQAMVIKNTQDVLLTTSTAATNSNGWYGMQVQSSSGGVSISRDGSNVLAFFHTSNVSGTSGTPVGTVSITTTATTYATSSDYRLKENVIAITDGITRLKQLKPSRFNFIADPSNTVDGFLAHEAAEVVPECATGEKDAVDDDGNPIYQGIDQSKLVPLLTAALQEAVAKIETLEARLTALESA